MNKNLQLIFNLILKKKISEASKLMDSCTFSLNELSEVNFLRGLINLNLKKYSKSLNFFKKNIHTKELQIDSVNNICIILQIKNKKKILLKLINLLLSFKPEKKYVLFNIAKIYDFLGDYNKSVKIIKEINEFDSEITAFHASLLRKQNLISEASDIIKNYKGDQNNYYILKEKASCLAYTERYDEALKIVNRLIQKYPEDQSLLFTKSTYLLNLNSFKSALKLFDYRFVKNPNKEKYLLNEKLWTGEITKKLLVWSEDGLGDHIIFLKLVEFVKNVDEIYIILDERLHSLYERYLIKNKKENIFIVKNKTQLSNYDAHIPAGNLMKYVNIKKIPKVNYLEPLSNEGFNIDQQYINIGISWKTLNKDHAYRSLPFDKFINIFSKFSNVKIYNLQFGQIERELQYCKENNIKLKVFKNLDYKEDIEKVSSLIQKLDLVVSSQNTVAHLASAIGKKILLLLPLGHRWYWNYNKISQIDNWYQNATVLKQNVLYHWNDLLDGLKNEIAKIKKN